MHFQDLIQKSKCQAVQLCTVSTCDRNQSARHQRPEFDFPAWFGNYVKPLATIISKAPTIRQAGQHVGYNTYQQWRNKF